MLSLSFQASYDKCKLGTMVVKKNSTPVNTCYCNADSHSYVRFINAVHLDGHIRYGISTVNDLQLIHESEVVFQSLPLA